MTLTTFHAYHQPWWEFSVTDGVNHKPDQLVAFTGKTWQEALEKARKHSPEVNGVEMVHL